jgi:hypothetical protein
MGRFDRADLWHGDEQVEHLGGGEVAGGVARICSRRTVPPRRSCFSFARRLRTWFACQSAFIRLSGERVEATDEERPSGMCACQSASSVRGTKSRLSRVVAAPAASAASFRPSRSAEITITTVRGSSRRMMRVVWIPSMPGIWKSSRTRSGRSSGRSRIASSPDPTAPTRRNPLVAEMTEAAARKKTSLSSATSTRARKPPMAAPKLHSSTVFAREEEGAEKSDPAGVTQTQYPTRRPKKHRTFH